MSTKSQALESLLALAGQVAPGDRALPTVVKSIFVLRNNDIGDLLVTTPLFEALRKQFPEARIVVGIGPWNTDILRNNPYIDDVMIVNAPWHNHSVKALSFRSAIEYIFSSEEAKRLRSQRFDVGIDIFGSNLGMLLLLRAGVRFRIGVRGFRGGESAAHWCVEFSPTDHVSRANLRIAEYLGATALPAPRPQIFLTEAETDDAEALWAAAESGARRAAGAPRIIIGPGSGDVDKCWPADRFGDLARCLAKHFGASILIVGGKGDEGRASTIIDSCRSAVSGVGKLSLRQSIAAASRADLVLCNSSMLMHAAAAFWRKTLTLLGPSCENAKTHEVLWGYPGTCRLLGKGTVAGNIATVAEAYDAAAAFLEPDFSRLPIESSAGSQLLSVE